MDIYTHYKAAALELLGRRDIGAFYSVGLSMSLLVAAAQDEETLAAAANGNRLFSHLACSTSGIRDNKVMQRTPRIVARQKK